MIDTALEDAAGHLERGQALMAVRRIVECYSLAAVDLSEEPQSTPEQFRLLAATLRLPDAGSAGWWLRVGMLWEQTGAMSLASACVGTARSLIDAGSRVTEEELLGIAEWSARRSCQQREPQAAITQQHRPELAPDRAARLALVFGSWKSRKSGPRDFSHISALAGKGDKESALVAALAKNREWNQRLMMTRWWYELRLYSAAIEQFFDVAAEESIEEWLPSNEGISGLLACGRSFQMIGDDVSAYAAFQVASWISGRASVQGENNKENDLAKTISEALEEVSGAKGLLHTRAHAHFWRGSGSYIVDFLLKVRAGTRAFSYFHERVQTLRQIFPEDALRLQIRGYRDAACWLRGGFPRRRRARSDVFQQLASRCEGRALPALAPTPLSAVQSSARPHRSGINLERPHKGMLRFVGQGQGHNGIAVPLGFRAGPVATRVTLPMGAGHRLVALGTKLDEMLPAAAVRKLVDQGCRVLWIDRSERTPYLRNSLPPGTARITAGTAVTNECRRWLIDAGNSAIIKRNLLAPNGVTPGYPWRAELDDLIHELWSQLSSDDLWRFIQGSPAEGVVKYVLDLVTGRTTDTLTGPESLRRLVSLMEIMRRVTDDLRMACRMAWEVPPESVGITESAGSLAYMQLPAQAAGNVGLTALLALNSFLETAAEPRDGAGEGDDFEISYRKVRPQSVSGSALPADEDDDQHDPEDDDDDEIVSSRERNDWVRHSLLAAQHNYSVCVVLSGNWSDDIGAALDVLGRYQAVAPHGAVLCFPDAGSPAQRPRLREYSDNLLLGALDETSIRSLDIALGTSVSGRHSSGRAARSCTLLTTCHERVIHTPVVIWS